MASHTMTIAGRAVNGAKTVEIRNPADGDLVGVYSAGGSAEVEAAVAAARDAFLLWRTTDDETRRGACRNIAVALDAHAEELARLLTLEQGKPLNGMGSRFELGGAAAWARYAAGQDLSAETLADDETGFIKLYRRPVGVVASITPWNWPLMIAIWHIAPAIRAGCTVVIKPSPYTPLSTLRMVEILNAVLPKGVLNVVAGEDAIGPMLTRHPDVAKVVFTGSSATGRRVMQDASGTLKRLTLELGGNDAGIVLPDADPTAIAEGLFWGAFINNGQTCAALKRLYVHDSIYDAVCSALTDFAKTVPMGHGLDENSLLGPIQNRMQFDKVSRLVQSTKDAGAKILTGGEPTGAGLFFPVTLIADVSDGSPVVDEEQFGPVLPIIRYHDVEDALRRANASENGLGGSVWSPDLARADALAQRLECGSAWINKHGAIRPDVPFGGVKSSGLGVEFGRQGLEEYTTLQAVHR